MDLAAFLPPGAHPVFLADAPDGAEPWGHVVRRPGRPLRWLALEPQPPGGLAAVRLRAPGWRLGPDGCLEPDGGGEAEVSLLAQVASCRRAGGVHVLRLKSLIRLLG
jgi:hypothetical protein